MDPDPTRVMTPPHEPEAAGDTHAPGTLLLGRYRIVARLGSGAMGSVYRAEDLELGQEVALKFLSRSFAADPRSDAALRNEVRLARKVTHPHVCRVHDIGMVTAGRSCRWSTWPAKTSDRCCGGSAGCRRTRRCRSHASSARACTPRTSRRCCTAT